MGSALIGYTGFVGSTLLKQAEFQSLYRSTNIHEIENEHFDTVVCAGAPAQKWLANKDPVGDKKKIEGLIGHLKKISCKKFILVSTVDVFKDPCGVTEETQIEESALHAYGLNRRILERFVIENFDDYLIVRLPGLVGPGLKKNIIFDFLNKNNLHLIDSRGVFQFYPMVNLWSDIQVALEANVRLLHLTSEPISVEDVARQGFAMEFEQSVVDAPAKYDMQSMHADLFGLEGKYQYSKRETIQAIRHYAQSEPMSITGNGG